MPLMSFLIAVGTALLSVILYSGIALGPPPERLNLGTAFHGMPAPWEGPAFPENWAAAAAAPEMTGSIQAVETNAQAAPQPQAEKRSSKRKYAGKHKRSKLAQATRRAKYAKAARGKRYAAKYRIRS